MYHFKYKYKWDQNSKHLLGESCNVTNKKTTLYGNHKNSYHKYPETNPHTPRQEFNMAGFTKLKKRWSFGELKDAFEQTQTAQTWSIMCVSIAPRKHAYIILTLLNPTFI